MMGIKVKSWWKKQLNSFYRKLISSYIRKLESRWKIEKGDVIVIGKDEDNSLDIWLVDKKDSWVYLEKIK